MNKIGGMTEIEISTTEIDKMTIKIETKVHPHIVTQRDTMDIPPTHMITQEMPHMITKIKEEAQTTKIGEQTKTNLG